MQAYRWSVLGVTAVAVIAGVTALGAAAWNSGEDCESFTDGLDSTVTHSVCGAILERYRAEGGPAKLGLPLSDEQPVTLPGARAFGDRELAFERGTIYVDRSTGKTELGQWFAYTPGEAPPR